MLLFSEIILINSFSSDNNQVGMLLHFTEEETKTPMKLGFKLSFIQFPDFFKDKNK